MAKIRQLEVAGGNQGEAPRLDPIAEARQKALVSLAGVLFDQTDEVNEGQTNRHNLISITRSPGEPATEESERSKMFAHLSQAIDYQTQGREDIAASEFEKTIQAGLSHPAAYFLLGLLQSRREQYEPALVNLRIAVKHPDFTMSSRLLMGAAMKKLGRLNEAAVEYLGALKFIDRATVLPQQANEMTQLYESLIDSQSQQMDKTACDNLCTNIASLLERPDWKDQLSRARQQLSAQAEGSLPLPLAEMMLQSHSGRVIESLASIQSMIEKNQVRTATEEAFFALMYAPGYLPLHIQIGEFLLKENRLQEAIQKFSIVAQVYSVRGEAAQAAQLLRRIIQLNPMDLSVRGRLIEALMAQGKVDEAIREDLDLAETYYRLTELEMARTTYTSALRLAQQSSSNRKWSTRILTRIADIDMQRMDWRQALRIFEQIRVLQPDDEKVHQNLIDINFRIGQENVGLTELDSFINFLEGRAQRGKAIQFVQNLINDRPGKIELHRRLADLYQKNGQLPQAIAEMDVMGELLITAGNKAGAINLIQSILTLNPPNAADYQKLLQQLSNAK